MAEGVPRERVAVIHNWADGELIRPIAPERNPLRREWGLEGRRVIGYSGQSRPGARPARGAGVRRRHERVPTRRWCSCSSAAAQASPSSRAWAAGSPPLPMSCSVPISRANGWRESLSVPDAHLVSLDPACEGLIMPSKLYGVLAAGTAGDRAGRSGGRGGQPRAAARGWRHLGAGPRERRARP